jgi:hypothetical protein
MSITRSQIARQLYARGGNTGYSDFASPSSSTASQDFATQAVSGGQMVVEVAVMIIFHSQLWLKKWTQLQKEEVEL